MTTLRVGGPAESSCSPESVEEAQRAVLRARDAGVPWRVLGRGSNVIARDEGVAGVVIQTRRLRWLRFTGGGRVMAGAGLPTSVLIGQTRERGLGGLEALVGYPASVGGAARMNAGGRWGETGDLVESVLAIRSDGALVELDARACRFGYRRSDLGGVLVLEVTFRLPEVEPTTYRKRIEAIHSAKAAVQPLAEASAGCIFRNPEGESAGRLVDACGLKGARIGGAVVSERHGNFIVNRGGASCDDVLRLVDHVQIEVERRAGVALELEVEVWGVGEGRSKRVPAAL